MAGTVEKAVRSQFKFALRNGGARLTLGGQEVDALRIEPDTVAGDLRKGRSRNVRTAFVGVIKADMPTRPEPLARATLDGWACVVAEDGVTDEPFAWRIQLRSPH